MSALLRAFRDFLREDGGYGIDKCRVMVDGKPPSIAGDRFVSVHYGYWRDNGSLGESLDVMCGVRVTVSRRSTGTAIQDVGEILIAPEDGDGIVDEAAKIVNIIHCDPLSEVGDTGIRLRANQIIGAAQFNGFITGPELIGDVGDPVPQPASWFGGTGGQSGLSVTMMFGNCNLVQKIEYQRMIQGDFGHPSPPVPEITFGDAPWTFGSAPITFGG